jgi:hypothetical protein
MTCELAALPSARWVPIIQSVFGPA